MSRGTIRAGRLLFWSSLLTDAWLERARSVARLCKDEGWESKPAPNLQSSVAPGNLMLHLGEKDGGPAIREGRELDL